MLSPAPVVAFEDGPFADDPAALLAWLQGRKGLVQLPVVVAFDDEHRLGIVRAWVGASEAAGLKLKLDDTAMGVALLDHLRTACPPGPTCEVWLEGTWGPVMAGMPDLDKDPSRHDFAVRRFAGLAEGSVRRARGQKG